MIANDRAVPDDHSARAPPPDRDPAVGYNAPVAGSDKPFRERIGDYLPFGFPVGLDLFPYTLAEFERLRAERPSWYRAIAAGVDLHPGPDPVAQGSGERGGAAGRRQPIAGGEAAAGRQTAKSTRSDAKVCYFSGDTD